MRKATVRSLNVLFENYEGDNKEEVLLYLKDNSMYSFNIQRGVYKRLEGKNPKSIKVIRNKDGEITGFE
jgi:hypothetical protein